MSAQPLHASVVIPSQNRRRHLEKCLKSLEQQTCPLSSFEVIVVDDGSSDDTPDFVQEFVSGTPLRLICLRQEARGPAAARNLGIEKSQGIIVAFIDDDCIPEPTWLEEITTGYSEGIGGMGGRILPVATDTWIGQYCAHKRIHETPVFRNGEIDYLITANASFSRKALSEVNGFDECHPFGGEDVDLSRRVRRMSYRLDYNQSAIVYHHHRESLKALMKTYYVYGAGDALNYKKKHARRLKIINHLFQVGLLVSIPLSVLMIPLDAARYCRDGLKGLRPIWYGGVDFFRRTAFRMGMVVAYFNYSKWG